MHPLRPDAATECLRSPAPATNLNVGVVVLAKRDGGSMSIRTGLLLLGFVGLTIATGVVFWKNRAADVRPREQVAPGEILIDTRQLADAGFALAGEYSGDVHDPGSLQELRAA